jgi:hypothetical protein
MHTITLRPLLNHKALLRLALAPVLTQRTAREAETGVRDRRARQALAGEDAAALGRLDVVCWLEGVRGGWAGAAVPDCGLFGEE